MEFKKIEVLNNPTQHFIDGKLVSKEAYDSLLEDYLDRNDFDEIEENKCPICEAVNEIVQILYECDDCEDARPELHALIQDIIDSTKASVLEELGGQLLDISEEIFAESN
jgi:hypothetical protein